MAWYNPASWDIWKGPQNPYQQQVAGGIQQGLQGLQGMQLTPEQMQQFRNAQMQQMQQLQGIAGGQQKGAGELAAERQAQNALAMQQSMARMARGGDAAMAMRNAANNATAIGQSAAGQGQQAALEDQMRAQGLLANVTGQARGQDIGQFGQNQQGQMNYLDMLRQLGQAQQQTQGQMIGGLMNTAGTLGGYALMSDERLKTDVANADVDIDEMLSGLVAKRYRYKDESLGKGSRVGIMAQDLERSRAGRDIVMETPRGKALDMNKALSAVLASSARLHKRLSDLEKAR